jgi:hypothetical protein
MPSGIYDFRYTAKDEDDARRYASYMRKLYPHAKFELWKYERVEL